MLGWAVRFGGFLVVAVRLVVAAGYRHLAALGFVLVAPGPVHLAAADLAGLAVADLGFAGFVALVVVFAAGLY